MHPQVRHERHGVDLKNGSSADMVDTLHTITCPYCEHEKQVPLDKLPTRPVGATCPKCGSRFMFKPSEETPRRDTAGVDKARYRDDYDIIKAEYVGFYKRLFSGQKHSLALILLIFVLYGLMYLIVTSVCYLNMKSRGSHVGSLSEYLQVVCLFALFYPAMIMHSWKFIDRSSRSIVDQLFSYKSVFIVVTIIYAMLLLITSHFLGSDEMPLGLVVPVIASALVPTFLHVFIDSL